MEFFEKAHVVKDKDLTKEKKSAESLKKQLKQMLYGYKNSNNQIIKDSLNIKTNFDDSSSVSGFSDLNLTSSSIDDLNESRSIQSYNNTPENDDNDSILSDNTSGNRINSENMDLISESSKKSDSLSKDFDSEIKDESISHLSDADISLASGMVESLTDSSETFDPSGELAGKILNRLSKKARKKDLKRKHCITSDEPCHSEMIESESSISDKVFSHSTKKSFVESHETLNSSQKNLHRIEENFEETSLTNSDLLNSFESDCRSPPFISITAVDMPCQSFDDVLGDYKHPTSKNLPIEHDNEFSLAITTDLFTEQTMNVDIHTEEDVSSLVPELDEEPVIDDIVDLESSDPCDESVNICENTIELQKIETEQPTDKIDDINNNLEFFYSSNNCVIVIRHPTELYVQGKVKIRALGGKVEVFGYTLHDLCYEIYAPYYSYAQCIKTVASENCYYGLFGKLTKVGLTVAEAENIVTTLRTNDAVICLEKFESQKGDFLETNFMLSNLFVKPYKHNDPYLIEASDALGCSLFSTRPWKYFIENPIWPQANQFSSKECSRGIICGGKGVGKSTYLRYQANKLLENGPVLVLDLDPGQCEFTVAGNVSATIVTEPLLGPNFTHLKKPEMMLNIGMINTMDNLKRYICAIQRLIFYCNSRDDLRTMPWIINTMGLTNELGMKIMVIIIMHSKPTYLMQYNSKSAKKCFDMYLNMESVKWFYNDNKMDFLFKHLTFPEDLDFAFILVEESAKPGKSSYSLTPKDERFLNYLAYFSELVDLHKTENLLAVTPYEISLRNISVYSNVKIKRDCIMKVLNAKVVALCAHTTQCDISRVFTLSDKPLVCHGHGLIRGVDCVKELLYIITPVPHDLLKLINCVVYADWSPDIGNFEAYLPNGTAVPYCTMAYEQHKHLMTSPRRRFNPLQLVNMTRSS